jgi:hypothetical protein
MRTILPRPYRQLVECTRKASGSTRTLVGAVADGATGFAAAIESEARYLETKLAAADPGE